MNGLLPAAPTPLRRVSQAARQRLQVQARRRFSLCVARLAVRSLHQELTLYPKPGLVSLIDNGSHADMNAATFVRSLFALRHYFRAITAAGMQGADFAQLRALGIAAEQRMLRATRGINTHRGAIFGLGMLCAAIGHCRARTIALSPQAIRAALLIRWGEALALHTRPAAQAAPSHGVQVAASHAASGAREEGALGFPSVFEVALPRMLATLADGRDWHCARTDGLFALMAHVSDTNVWYRGGAHGAQLVRTRGAEFLAAGGTADPRWIAKARACHHEFVQHRLSPGGAADLLAAACLVYQACALTEDGIAAFLGGSDASSRPSLPSRSLCRQGVRP